MIISLIIEYNHNFDKKQLENEKKEVILLLLYKS